MSPVFHGFPGKSINKAQLHGYNQAVNIQTEAAIAEVQVLRDQIYRASGTLLGAKYSERL